MENCYKEVFNIYENSDDYKYSWEQLYLDLRINYATNTDFYIEMNSKTPLGKFGKVGNGYKIHFDIFSNKNFIKNNNQLLFDVADYEKFYNKKDSVKLLQEKLNVEKIKKSLNTKQLYELYNENKEKLVSSVLTVLNDIVEPTVSDKTKIENALKKAVGYNEQNDTYREKKEKVDEKLFISNKELIDRDLKANILYYYHPANVLIELNKMITKDKIFDLFK